MSTTTRQRDGNTWTGFPRGVVVRGGGKGGGGESTAVQAVRATANIIMSHQLELAVTSASCRFEESFEDERTKRSPEADF